MVACLGACGPEGGGTPSGWSDGMSGSVATTGGGGGISGNATASAGNPAGTGGNASAGASASAGAAANGSQASTGRGGRPDAGSAFDGGALDGGPPCTPKGGTLTGCAAMVPTSIFAKNCAASGCHDPAVNQSQYAAYGLDLTSPGVALRLYNVRASENTPTSNYKLIDPQTPETSYVLLKVKMNMPPIGTQMPSMGTKLSAQQQQCLHDWIVTEAANCGRL